MTTKAKQRKTLPGSTFSTTVDAVRWILNGNWVYINDKPVSNNWVVSWRLSTIKRYVADGVIGRCYDSRTGMPYSSYRND